jgi:hypothetical protein
VVDSVGNSTAFFVLVVVQAVLFLVIAGSRWYAVWADVAARGGNRVGWLLFTLIFGIFAIPVYAVYCVGRSRDRETPPGNTERTFRAVGLGGYIGLIGTAFVTPPDAITMSLVRPPLVVVSIVAVRAIDRYRDPGVLVGTHS